MAFHFNWSPLIADTDRVRHMLTSSLNKTPKPPIIVDDIIVNELNLGSTPPSLEILEVGDLAEDRFRGVFRVKYEGDAYLTLRTRVQANPLNTFLSTKSEWVSPGVGAAGSGLTIPLQITLSDIRMSGFVILVFSKQKGITLVFRNDPLESLKVSSTFDSIPFVREYLQRTIEGQLRVLFMEDLPAIIHRLSLRVFNAEEQGTTEKEQQGNREVERRLDANFERETRAVQGGEEDSTNIFGFEPRGETYADFSQKNLLRLAALTESQRTLSLFTPVMRDTVYRAWSTSADRMQQDGGAMPSSLHRPTLSRIQSQLNMSHGHGHPASALSSAASFTSETTASQATRPSLASMASAPTTYTLSSAGGQGRPRPRKRKNRVVNLRKNKDEGSAAGTDDAGAGEDGVSVSSGYDTASRSESLNLSSGEASTGVMMKEDASTVPTSTSSLRPSHGEREGEVFTPHGSPKKKIGWREQGDAAPSASHAEASSGTVRASTRHQRRPVTPRNPHLQGTLEDPDETPRQSMYLPPEPHQAPTHSERPRRAHLPRMQTLPTQPPSNSPHHHHHHQPSPHHYRHHPQREPSLPRTSSDLSISDMISFPTTSATEEGHDSQGGSNGGILEQAWMMKMATEIAKRVAEEKEKGRPWRPEECGEEAPPAYVS